MKKPTPQLTWEVGTAYDMFLSLHVLYDPDRYGLRGAWAAGVRSRLPTEEREFLQRVIDHLWPLSWIYHLPPPHNSQAVLDGLKALPVRQRLTALAMLPYKWGRDINERLCDVAERGQWDTNDYNAIRAAMSENWSRTPSKKDIESRLDMWARPDEFGELIIPALQAYQQAFFAEEEERIRPALREMAQKGQEMAQRMPLLALLEELSQGLRFEKLPEVKQIVLVPSFWITPLLAEYPLGQEGHMYVFGARPADVSLVPGEHVPDALYQALKALADPTRLRILHYLTMQPLSPSGLARLLRLRPPTVIHHLHILRLARLVHLTMGAEGKRRYTIRPGAVEATFASLQNFLEKDENLEEE